MVSVYFCKSTGSRPIHSPNETFVSIREELLGEGLRTSMYILLYVEYAFLHTQ